MLVRTAGWCLARFHDDTFIGQTGMRFVFWPSNIIAMEKNIHGFRVNVVSRFSPRFCSLDFLDTPICAAGVTFSWLCVCISWRCRRQTPQEAKRHALQRPLLHAEPAAGAVSLLTLPPGSDMMPGGCLSVWGPVVGIPMGSPYERDWDS